MLVLGGDWLMAHGAPDLAAARAQLAAAQGAALLRFDATSLGRWDTILPSFLVQILRLARDAGLEVDLAGLPEGAARLVKLATAVPSARRRPIGRGARLRRARSACRRSRSAATPPTCWPSSARPRVAGVPAGARPGAGARSRLLARGAAGRRRRAADRHADQRADRHDPGLRRRHPARRVRRPDLRRQPRRDRHGARDGGDDGGRDHGRPDRRGLCRRARHDAGQRGDRRAAHARDLADRVPGPAAPAGAGADAAAARDLRQPVRHAGRGRGRRRPVRPDASPSTTSRACSSSACTTSPPA